MLQIKLYPLSFLKGTNPKKPSAPDMFTESDDMFAAYFDVSTPPVALIPLRCLDSDHHDLCQCVFNFFFFLNEVVYGIGSCQIGLLRVVSVSRVALVLLLSKHASVSG